MRIATKLAIVLIAIALGAKLSAQQPAVIINLTELGRSSTLWLNNSDSSPDR